MHPDTDVTPPMPGPAVSAGRLRLAVGAALLIVGMVYAWSLTTNPDIPMAEARGWKFYPLMVEGWLQGRLDLPVEVPAGLKALPDPYDPQANIRFRLENNLHDMSYYGGKLYIYFGPAPAVVAFLPWRLLTGQALSTPWAVAGFCWMGFLANTCLLLALRRRYFPGVGPGAVLLALLVVGLCNWAPVLLRRANIWEMPIAAAYFFLSTVLLCLHESLHGARRRPWLIAAGVAYGLAVASRPDCALGAVVLLVPLAWRLRGEPRAWTHGHFWSEALAVSGPLVAIVAGMLWFNHQRFGNPLEFGQSYQLSGNHEGTLRHFNLAFVPFNGWLYWLATPGLGVYFPFLRPSMPAVVPAGQFGVQEVYGLLWVLPVLGLAPLSLWRWTAFAPARRATMGMIAVVAGLWAAPFIVYGGATARYEMIMASFVAVLAAVGIFLVETALAGQVRWRRLVRVAWTGLFGVSVGATLLASIQHKLIFRTDHPGAYRWLAHAFDQPVAWWERRENKPFGPCEMQVQFPSGRSGELEPLMVTGAPPYLNGVVVYYVDDSHVRFGVMENAGKVDLGGPVFLDRGTPHDLLIALGSLYPPDSHPFFDGLPEERRKQLTTAVEVVIDGRIVLAGHAGFYDAVASEPLIGGPMPGRPDWRFTGRIISSVRLPVR